MAAPFVVLLDACVLYPAPLREETLNAFGIMAEHPDQFISNLFDLAPPAIAIAVRDQRGALKNPPRSVEELLDTFLSLGLAETVARLRAMEGLL